MTFPTTILTGTTIADSDLEGLQAAQVNAYGNLLPRHIAANEFRSVSDDLAIGDTIQSQHFSGVVDGANPAICIGAFDNYSAGDKGLRLLYETGSITERKIRLQDQFDLLHADHGGNATDILMYVWMTQKTKAVANLHAIAGFGYQTTVDAQWLFDFDGAADNYRIRVLSNGGGGHATIDFGALGDDVPTLFAWHIRPVSAGSGFWKLSGYKNGVLVGTSGTTPAFPFNDVSGASWAGNPPYPLLGRRGGYNIGHDCIVHGVGIARITEFDDVGEFLQSEYDRNSALLA